MFIWWAEHNQWPFSGKIEWWEKFMRERKPTYKYCTYVFMWTVVLLCESTKNYVRHGRKTQGENKNGILFINVAFMIRKWNAIRKTHAVSVLNIFGACCSQQKPDGPKKVTQFFFSLVLFWPFFLYLLTCLNLTATLRIYLFGTQL